MNLSPVLFFHICAGTSGLFSGAAALSFRKGSRWHALAGRVFVGSMLAMAAGAVYLAIVKHQPNNIGGGIFTFYLILTAWLTARRADGETSKFDWVAFLIPLALGNQKCNPIRSEEHTSELQSHSDLVCRLLLEKKKRESALTRQQNRLSIQ